MQIFICVRHGDYTRGHLDASGQAQMTSLAENLKPYLKGHSVLVLSSSAPRASESAEVLCQELGIDGFESHEILWCDDDHWQDRVAVLELVKQKQSFDVVILLTHLEYAEIIPACYAEIMDLGDVPFYSLEYGEAYILDCVNQVGQKITPKGVDGEGCSIKPQKKEKTNKYHEEPEF